MQMIMKGVKLMTNKAYIVTNKRQEMAVLEELEREGYLWRGTDMNPTEKHRLIDEPITIFARDDKRLTFNYRVNEAYLADYEIEIDFDGRKEERMSEKYVVSQEFMDKLEGWKHDLILEDAFFVNQEAINNMPKIIKNWWVDDYETIGESNKRLISIIRYMSGANDFEVEKPKKWVVRSKDSSKAGRNLYAKLDISYGVKTTMTFWGKSNATMFDTKEEAQSWANSHQEVVQVEVEE